MGSSQKHELSFVFNISLQLIAAWCSASWVGVINKTVIKLKWIRKEKKIWRYGEEEQHEMKNRAQDHAQVQFWKGYKKGKIDEMRMISEVMGMGRESFKILFRIPQA